MGARLLCGLCVVLAAACTESDADSGPGPGAGTEVEASTSSVTPAPGSPPPTVAPATTVARPTATAPADTASFGTDVLDDLGVGGDEPTVLSRDEARPVLAAIDAERFAVLRQSPGFSATSTNSSVWMPDDTTSSHEDPPPRRADITVLESGAVWADYANGDWWGFDPATGVGRGVFQHPDGSLFPQETVFAPRQHNYRFVIDHDPLMPLAPLAELSFPISFEITRTAFEGRTAVQVVSESTRTGRVRHVVDLTSGLVVESDATQFEETGTQRFHSAISGIAQADSLPADAPRPLPAGLEWVHLEDPLTPSAASIEQAADAFGSRLILPAAALGERTVVLDDSAVARDGRVIAPDAAAGVVRNVVVTWVSIEGLTRTVVTTTIQRPGAAGTVPPGYTQVDDWLCHEPCDEPVVGLDPPAFVPDGGALAGVPFYGTLHDFSVGSNGPTFTISAPTSAEALAVANSLIAVQPQTAASEP